LLHSRRGKTRAPVFGTHDWIAFKGYVLAGRPAFIQNNLNRYFIGTEAPDNGFKPSNADGNYNDASACHCILFDEDGNLTRDRAELRVRQEFDKALGALANGDPALAAFYAGALAHYMGDLGQFYHIMGSQSHWGSEDQTRHSAYEVAVEGTIRFQNRTSMVFEGFISPTPVDGDTPKEIARAVALRVERGTGTSGRTPGFMDERFAELKNEGLHSKPDMWDEGFRNQTGQNINVAANGIAKLLRMMVEEDD
jgi:Zinc dependent phospholipase C